MQAVAARAVPTLGDWCSLHFRPTSTSAVETVVAHADPDRVAWADELRDRYPFDPDASTGVAAVIRSGEAEFIRDVTQETLADAIADSPFPPLEVQPILDELQLTSLITVPLTTKQGVIGAMQFVSRGERPALRRRRPGPGAGGRRTRGRDPHEPLAHRPAPPHLGIAAGRLPAAALPVVPGVEVTARVLARRRGQRGRRRLLRLVRHRRALLGAA